MKAWSIAVTTMILGALAGCGGGSSVNSMNLTQAQAKQVGSTVSNDVSKALASVVGSPAVPLGITTRDNMRAALLRNKSQAGALANPSSVTCSGSSCTVSGTFNCPDGGSIAVSGTFTASGTSANGTVTATPSKCSDGTLVIDGNPDVTATVQGNDNGVMTTVSLTIGGDVSFSPVQAGQFPSGSCSLNVAAMVTVNNSTGMTTTSISGTICGQTIN